MKVKVCFNNEIHKLSKLPPTFTDFTQLITSLFHNQLPKYWTLQYTDSNNKKILLNNEDTFTKFKEQGNEDANVTSKLYIIPSEQPSEIVVREKEEGEYQIIQKVEEIKIKEIPEFEEEKKEEQESDLQETIQNKEVIPENKVMMNLDDLEKMIINMINTKISESLNIQDISVSESVMIEQNKKNTMIVHEGVRCDGCQMMPIVGIRYRCTQCPNFNYCEGCEESCEHIHDFVKLRKSLPLSESKNANIVEKKEEKVRQEVIEKEGCMMYYEALRKKAEKLQKCFPKEDFDMLCVYVNEAPEDMTIAELVENFKH